jgi:hypothetical protein
MNPTDDMMRQALAAGMPNLKTQAQFTLFMTCFDILRSTVNSYYGGDAVAAELAREALNKALDMAKQVPDVVEKLQEIPEEERSEAAKEFTAPAKELHEYDEHKSLIVELAALGTLDELGKWYDTNRSRIDRVVSQNLRNNLFDTIRDRRKQLETSEAN